MGGQEKELGGVLGGEHPPSSLPQSGLGRIRSLASGVRGRLK